MHTKLVSLICLVSLALLVSNCDSAKILFLLPGGTYSHKVGSWYWATELADKGHDVTFLSSFEKKPTNNTKVKDLASKTLYNLMSASYDIDRFQSRRDHQHHDILTKYNDITIEICRTMLFKAKEDPVLNQFVNKDLRYDLVVLNAIFGECGWILASVYEAKIILFDAAAPMAWFNDLYGYGSESTWIPDIMLKVENTPMSFYERVKNTLMPLYWYWDRRLRMHSALENFMKEAFSMETVPSMLDLERNASLVIINSHPATDFAHSLPPFFIKVGGTQSYLPENPIPEVYQSFMDGAGERGVVLISFGSSINLEKVPKYYIDMFFNLIKRHPDIRFLLKWQGPLPVGFENGLENLLTSNWLPQRELLRHPKLKGFITHAGLNSIQEATYYGVPLIALPLFADQDYNAYRLEYQNIGIRLEIRDMTLEMIDDALMNLLNNPKYKHNMEVKSRIFRDRPQTPLETLTFWTEFVLRNDDVSALKPMTGHLNWFQLRNIDVYFAFFAILASILFLVALLLAKIVTILRNQSSGKSKNSIRNGKKKKHL